MADDPDPTNPDDVLEQIEEWVACYANLMSPATAAAELERLAAELRTLQPTSN